MLVARLKGYLDGLPPKTRRRIVLAMLAAFAVLALYTFGKAVYDIGRNDGSRIVTDHAGQVELSVKPKNNHNVIPVSYTHLGYPNPCLTLKADTRRTRQPETQ